MSTPTSFKDRWARRQDSAAARKAGKSKARTRFVTTPEPHTIGHFARGKQLMSGKFPFSGQLVEAPGRSIWDVAEDTPVMQADIHGSDWLDDLAAVGDARARDVAQIWVWDWIERHDDGSGPGWTPDLTGRRLMRWINHSDFLLRKRDETETGLFYRALARQAQFLAKRWPAAPTGRPRFEALTGMVHASLILDGMQVHADASVAALAADCDALIDSQGALPTRNPEELMEVCTLLLWAKSALIASDRAVPGPINWAIERAVPVLRALRHSDGGLARFHGGGRGIDGRLDQVLVGSGVRDVRNTGLAMGYARVMGARTSVIIDGAAPPQGDAARDAHASTLAFEMTSGRRPLIVNCGAGGNFGTDWRHAGRATASHSTVAIDGASSSRLDAAGLLTDGPGEVICDIKTLEDGTRLEMAHDGWKPTHGLTHARTLDITSDGRSVVGEDVLTALDRRDEVLFNKISKQQQVEGLAFSLRFHLHPEVDAQIDAGDGAVTMRLKSGETWIFHHDGGSLLNLSPSIYLESGRLRPRATQQVVLTARAMSYATRVRWSLSKAQDTPDSMRDLGSLGAEEVERGFGRD